MTQDASASPVTDLATLLANLDPAVRDGEYVVVSLDVVPADVPVAAMVVEDEGVTVVVERSVADGLGWTSDFVAAWITLTVQSSLEAVGLTAAFSTALADEGISCNVLAGFHHDHMLVPLHQRDAAVRVLASLSGEPRRTGPDVRR